MIRATLLNAMARLVGTNLKETAAAHHGEEELVALAIEGAEGEEVARRAVEVASPSVIIELALEADSAPRSERLGEHLSDGELSDILDEREL
ncbi:MAG: hypothetical protein SXQ77_01905, partial [Halobacteria archaeon]|nr:hypothetical protein [Halobacteria archaeon]